METTMQAAALNANTGLFSHPFFLRRVLLLDALTCVITGLSFTVGHQLIHRFTALPPDLLQAAGFSLFPIALFMTVVALRKPIPASGVWLVILGNIAWVFGSFYLLTGAVLFNTVGAGFILMQAAAVAALAALETLGVLRR
jgi:hypothetical protein